MVKSGEKPKLRKVDPSFTGDHETENDAAGETAHYLTRLASLQHLLYASGQASLLIVLQGLDGSGKDGTMSHVMAVFNPQGAAVTGFKVPTSEERAHDFLWRVHPHTPSKGAIAIFNRSHYEDVLVPRVHGQIDRKACAARFRSIRAFERLLHANGTQILKFYLHISKAEQLARFERRLDDPKRNWKISEADYVEREYWDAYTDAYEDAIAATSRKRAPWFVIPANHKWFRNLAVSQIVASALEGLHLTYPKPSVDLADIRRRYHAAAAGG